MKKAVIYSRVSTLEQDYASQTKDLQREAERQGYEVIHIYEEKESGFVDERPELAKVLALTKEDTDAVFVWEISRLSRRTVMVLSTIEAIEQKGILIYSLNENYRSWNDKGKKDSTSKLVLTLYASIAESEATKFKERSRRGKRYRVLVEKKAYCKDAPFGYRINEAGCLEIVEEDAAIVRDIFQKAAEGYSERRLLLYLKSQYNREQSVGGLQGILKNEAYAGRKYLGKERKGKNTKKPNFVKFFNPETDSVETPAIISPELFQKVQTERRERQCRSKSQTPNFKLLRGLFVCTRCGRAFTKDLHLYFCYSRARVEMDSCGSTSIDSKTADELVWKVTDELFSDEITKELAQQNALPLEEEIASLQQEIEGYEQTLKGFTPRLNQLVKAISLLPADAPIEALTDQIEAIGKEQKIIKAEISDRKLKIEALQKKLATPTEKAAITDEKEKYDFLHRVIEGLFLYGDYKRKVLTIMYVNGITVHCLKVKRLTNEWYWFIDRGDLVIEDSVKLEQAGAKNLKAANNTLIEVTSSNSAYYSGEDTDVEIFGNYTIEGLYAALLQNKQLKKVELTPTNGRTAKKK